MVRPKASTGGSGEPVRARGEGPPEPDSRGGMNELRRCYPFPYSCSCRPRLHLPHRSHPETPSSLVPLGNHEHNGDYSSRWYPPNTPHSPRCSTSVARPPCTRHRPDSSRANTRETTKCATEAQEGNWSVRSQRQSGGGSRSKTRGQNVGRGLNVLRLDTCPVARVKKKWFWLQ
jgi:hypothetical protein